MTATVKKHTVKDETDTVVKEMYFLTLTEGTDSLQINVGQKTYETVQKMLSQVKATAKK